MIKEIIRAWVGQPEERVLLLHLPPELYSGLETLAFIVNQRRRDLGSAQGGVDNWGLTTMEELIQEAVADMIRKHIQVSQPRAAASPKYDYGSGRVQRR